MRLIVARRDYSEMARGQDSVIINDSLIGKPEKYLLMALRERAVPQQAKKVIEHQEKRKKYADVFRCPFDITKG